MKADKNNTIGRFRIIVILMALVGFPILRSMSRIFTGRISRWKN